VIFGLCLPLNANILALALKLKALSLAWLSLALALMLYLLACFSHFFEAMWLVVLLPLICVTK